jgi:hypothetical protein
MTDEQLDATLDRIADAIGKAADEFPEIDGDKLDVDFKKLEAAIWRGRRIETTAQRSMELWDLAERFDVEGSLGWSSMEDLRATLGEDPDST